MLPDETAKSACAHLLAALRYYRSLGVRIERVMTDHGSAYKSRCFAKPLMMISTIALAAVLAAPVPMNANENRARRTEQLRVLNCYALADDLAKMKPSTTEERLNALETRVKMLELGCKPRSKTTK